MGTFNSFDGSRLAYHGAADYPVVCLPGGPMTDSAYLGDLGGLDDVVRLDLRGTGESEAAAVETYRVDRQVEDVEALRQHLGLDRLTLLGHSAGGALAILYAQKYPENVERMTLVAPSPRPVGIDVTDADRREVAELRRGEPWFADAFAAFERIWAGEVTPENFDAISPFWHGDWNDAARAMDAFPTNEEAARQYYAEGALDPAATRKALGELGCTVTLIAGEYDVALPPKRAEEYAGLFLDCELLVVPGTGHNPWMDAPDTFRRNA